MTTRGITTLIHGAPKVGKTWLGASAPAPVLILDAESGGAEFISRPKVHWDWQAGPPPAPDGTWEVTIATVTTADDIARILAYTRNDWPYRSVVMDSITAIQARIRQQLAPSGAMEIADWGRLLAAVERLVRHLCDLPLYVPMTEAVIMIAGSKMDDHGKWIPLIQGASREVVEYAVDLLAWLTVTDAGERRLLTRPKAHAAAGNRLGGLLPEVLTDPDLTDVITTLTGGKNGDN